MKARTFLLGAAAYVLVTFPLAYVWHLVAFRTLYERLGYFTREEPIVALGFLAIVAQGLVLAGLYPLLRRGRGIGDTVKFALVMGFFLWTSQVIAEAAKHPLEPLATWLAIETLYCAIQFASFGLVLGLVDRSVGRVSGKERLPAV